MTWWKFIFDTKTPTWQKYGCVTFVQAADECAARVAGTEAAAAEFPGAEIRPHDIGESTPVAAEAFAEKRRRLALWQENVRTGVPNTPEVLTERDARGAYKVPYAPPAVRRAWAKARAEYIIGHSSGKQLVEAITDAIEAGIPSTVGVLANPSSRRGEN